MFDGNTKLIFIDGLSVLLQLVKQHQLRNFSQSFSHLSKVKTKMGSTFKVPNLRNPKTPRYFTFTFFFLLLILLLLLSNGCSFILTTKILLLGNLKRKQTTLRWQAHFQNYLFSLWIDIPLLITSKNLAQLLLYHTIPQNPEMVPSRT